MSNISVRGDVLEIEEMDENEDGILVTITLRVHSDGEANALARMSKSGMGFLMVEDDCCDE